MKICSQSARATRTPSRIASLALKRENVGQKDSMRASIMGFTDPDIHVGPLW